MQPQTAVEKVIDRLRGMIAGHRKEVMFREAKMDALAAILQLAEEWEEVEREKKLP